MNLIGLYGSSRVHKREIMDSGGVLSGVTVPFAQKNSLPSSYRFTLHCDLLLYDGQIVL